MRVLIIRHGQTDWNKQGLLQGTIDIPLNDVGIEQAVNARAQLENEKIDVCFCSPLTRTRQTADALLDGSGVPIIYDERIVERGFGEFEGSSIYDIDFDSTWIPGSPSICKGMESFEMLYERVADFFDDIYEEYKDKTVLVVTHGGTSIMCGFYFCGPTDDRSKYFCQNCVVKEYNK